MATQAEVREFISQVRKRGYKVTKAGTKHYKVLNAKGSVVVDDHGPLIISATPSDANWRDMAVQRFKRAGVLADDPYKATRGTKGVERDGDGGDKQSQEDERKQKEREAVTRAARARGDDFRTRSRELRSQVERMAVKLGGWNRAGGAGGGLSMVDFMAAVRHFSDESDEKHPWPTRTGIPTSVAAASQTLYTLRQPDKTIGGTWLPLLEAFVDRLYEADPNDPQLAADRFRVMVAAARGTTTVAALPTRRSPVAPGAGVADPIPDDVANEVDEDADEPETEPEVVVLPPPRILPRRSSPTVRPDAAPVLAPDVVLAPKLALRALYFMARGSENGQVEDVLKLAEQLVELELNSPAERARRTRSSE